MSDKNNKISMIVWNEFLNDYRVLKEAETLQKTGYELTVHAIHTPGVTQKTQTLSSGVKVIRITRSLFWSLRKGKKVPAKPVTSNQKIDLKPVKKISRLSLLKKMISRLWGHIKFIFVLAKGRPDFIHAHDANTLPTAWLAAKLCGAKLIYDAHEISTSREGYDGIRKWIAFFEKTLMPRAEFTMSTTEYRAKTLQRHYRLEKKPLVLQNRPVLSELSKSKRLRDELNIPEEQKIILYQGGLQQGRGLHLLIEAFTNIRGAHLVYIGGGKLESSLKILASKSKNSKKIHFIPTVSLVDLPSYTMSADIGVQPIENTCLNHWSTDSNKLFEYIGAGLPVVASAMPEIKNILDSYEVGLSIEPSNVEELAQALQRLIDDNELYKTMSQKALKARQELTWEKQEHVLIDAYGALSS